MTTSSKEETSSEIKSRLAYGLIDRLAKSKKYEEFVAQFSPERFVVQVQNLAGSSQSLVSSAIHLHQEFSQILIASDKEEAAYLYNDLQSLLGDNNVHFLTDSFKRPNQFTELKNEQVLARTTLVGRISLMDKKLVVTYPEALVEMVVKPDILSSSSIRIEKAKNLDSDRLIVDLVSYGFNRTDFVYEPGQFSIRGGIIDIFSFGNDWPYRIELFDSEVESIRTFHPMDQLSLQNIQRIQIIPNVNNSFETQDKISFFDLFDSKNTTVWIRDQTQLLIAIEESYKEAMSYADQVSKVDETEWAAMMKDRSFVDRQRFIDGISKFNLFLQKPNADLKLNATVDFDFNPQSSFNRKFDLVIAHMRDNIESGIENVLVCENPKQFKRFDAIFTDLNANLEYAEIPISLHEGFHSKSIKLAVLTDHQIFNRFHRYKLGRGFSKDQALNLKMIKQLVKGDFVTHIDHGVGRFSGLEKIEVGGKTQESVRIIYKNNDVLYVGINSLHKISKYIGKEGKAPSLSKLGSDSWKTLKSRTKKKVKDIARNLIKLYARRKQAKGHAFAIDGYLQNELEASFMYEDTPDQEKATLAVKKDMQSEYPMDRLICGDVGFGKTEIALRAIFKAVVNGKQAALLVPTTILALQHYQTFKDRLKDFGISIDYINRFRSAKEKRLILEKLEDGKLELVIGTHALLNKKTKFKDLGILVIDEEQKFGVSAKERLREFKVNVDTLTLTATPIPRTLQFSLMSARDMSILRTAPPNRQPIHTEIRVFDEKLIRESIYYEIHRGGQVFFVHNRVKSLLDMTAIIKRLCPDLEVAFAHGQMEASTLENTLKSFIDREIDVLVCTNIIETGLDIANANTIIINNAHHFGLSDLHQLRGRVGRSNTKAYCYLFCPPLSVVTPEARKRLRTIEEFSDLGSGLDIAMRDLDIRGAGNLLGAEQSGFISELGFDAYQRILDETIQELKESEFSEVFDEEGEERDYVRDVEIELEDEMLLPDSYVNNVQERLKLYTDLDKVNDETDLDAFRSGLQDRFGPIPRQAEGLFDALRLRWRAKRLGFERLHLKNGRMKCFFISQAQSPFYESKKFGKILDIINHPSNMKRMKLKNTPRNLILIIEEVGNVEQAKLILTDFERKINLSKK